MRGYVYGQLCNVAKAGVWWVTFSPLVLALFTGFFPAIGFTRLVFNLALFLVSPWAGAMVGSWAVKTVLNFSTILRLLVYVVFVPVSWLFLQTRYLKEWVDIDNKLFKYIFLGCFLLFVGIDGIAVSFSNLVDIDCGGLNLLANQLDVTVTDEDKERYASLHVAIFEGSMIVLAPLVALGCLIGENYYRTHDALILLIAMATVYGLFSTLSLSWYNCGIPKVPLSFWHKRPSIPNDYCSQICRSLGEGMELCCSHRPLFWRLIFLCAETGFEDSVICLIIVAYAVNVSSSFRRTHGNRL